MDKILWILFCSPINKQYAYRNLDRKMNTTPTMVESTASLWRSLRAYQIYGANTDVGKTVMSTILCKSFARRNPKDRIWYLKPVSTGPESEADDRHLARFSPQTNTRCLFQFDQAVSPHIAARSKPVGPFPTSIQHKS